MGASQSQSRAIYQCDKQLGLTYELIENLKNKNLNLEQEIARLKMNNNNNFSTPTPPSYNKPPPQYNKPPPPKYDIVRPDQIF